MNRNSASKQGVLLHLSRRIRGHCAGTLVGRDERGPLVDYPTNPHGAIPARATIVLPEVTTQRTEVLLVFEQERSDRPVIVGLFEPIRLASSSPEGLSPPIGHDALEALLDGRRVVLDATDEIVLRCGKASITLRRNGRIVVRGSYVETEAEGVNRIKGGAVRIN